jgi:hypothetical protein
MSLAVNEAAMKWKRSVGKSRIVNGQGDVNGDLLDIVGPLLTRLVTRLPYTSSGLEVTVTAPSDVFGGERGCNEMETKCGKK